MRRGLSVLALGILAVFPACEESLTCTTEARYGLAVTVLDGAEKVCQATVTATDGTHSETLEAFVPSCVYQGAAERPGTYTVTATKDGKTGTVEGVVVPGGECHVTTKSVTVQLNP